MEKEFGKLTNEQFYRLVHLLPEIRHSSKELTELARSKQERLDELLGPKDYCWGSIYEFPFIEQIALLFVILGMHEPLRAAATDEDPQERVLEWAEDGGTLDQWYAAHEAELDKRYLLWLAVILQRNILSIMLYHQSMGALVESVRQGDDSAFFKAVRVDRTVLTCPTFADRLAKAEFTNDRNFLRHLRSAIKGPSQKHMEAIQDLRYSIVVLRELGFSSFSDRDLEKLFISTGLYPNSAGALNNLRKHIRDAKKVSTI